MKPQQEIKASSLGEKLLVRKTGGKKKSLKKKKKLGRGVRSAAPLERE